jgi:hypothetical protein
MKGNIMNKLQEDGLKHLKELQIKIESLEKSIKDLKKELDWEQNQNKILLKVIETQAKDYYTAINTMPCVAELVIRDLNELTQRMRKLYKRDHRARRKILSEIRIDDKYNQKQY